MTINGVLKKSNYFIPLFIASSLAALIIAPAIFGLIRSLSLPSDTGNNFKIAANSLDSDPLITKNANYFTDFKKPTISADDPVLGNLNAPVTITIFSDFLCSFCQDQESVIRQLKEKYNNQVKLVWKDYPDEKSWQASLAARCAQDQDKFWEYHDLLYGGEVSEAHFLDLAGALNLNKSEFKSCLKDKNDEMKTKIARNINEADALNIAGVPFLYINDQEIFGKTTLKELEAIVKNELSK